MIDDLIQGIRNKNIISISKAITLAENEDDLSLDILSSLYPLKTNSHRIGITGPPGAGKSTITNLLIKHFRKNKKSVAVLLVDPTSPYSNGAVLGDRIRMFNYHNDNNVFIRSFATRGSKGGLSKNINKAADILQAAQFDIIIFETVGVGQVEIDVVEQVDTVVLTLVPESGDDIQMMKAGIIEIADIFVINKSDRKDADKLFVSLKNMLSFSNKDKGEDLFPKIIKTIAIEDKGIKRLMSIISSHKDVMIKNNTLIDSKLNFRYANEVYDLVQNQIVNEFWSIKRTNILNDELQKKFNKRISPVELFRKIIKNGEWYESIIFRTLFWIEK